MSSSLDAEPVGDGVSHYHKERGIRTIVTGTKHVVVIVVEGVFFVGIIIVGRHAVAVKADVKVLERVPSQID